MTRPTDRPGINHPGEVIQPGQIYRSADPRGGPRIRVDAYTRGHNHAWVVNAHDGARGRWVLVRNLHDSPDTKTGARRRTGYVLERPTTSQPEPGVEPDEQAFLDLHGPRTVPTVTIGPLDASTLHGRPIANLPAL
ncbi:hypothetical protein [Streptomyces gardneri]|uniref:hypothetical protein n=1 Tax=Streptomyces gardneri TaxID=66892 RepID=UPI0035DEEC9F